MDQRESIIKKVKDEDIQFIRMQFTDIFGAMKNVAITPAQLEKAMDNKIMFDGSSIDGFVRIEESDMVLYPDLNSFTIHPWGTKNGKVARFICDIYTPDHKPFEVTRDIFLKKPVLMRKNWDIHLMSDRNANFSFSKMTKTEIPRLK